MAGLAAMQRAELALAAYMDSMYSEVRGTCTCFVFVRDVCVFCVIPGALR